MRVPSSSGPGRFRVWTSVGSVESVRGLPSRCIRWVTRPRLSCISRFARPAVGRRKDPLFNTIISLARRAFRGRLCSAPDSSEDSRHLRGINRDTVRSHLTLCCHVYSRRASFRFPETFAVSAVSRNLLFSTTRHFSEFSQPSTRRVRDEPEYRIVILLRVRKC